MTRHHPARSAPLLSVHPAVQFDGLVGPTHDYGGLSPGNLASEKSRGHRSNPRAAALQGLTKMRRVLELGGLQAVLPPQPRPDVAWLRRLGFTGTPAQVLSAAARHEPDLLRRAASASAMWTANAATVCPSTDSGDGRVHLSVANLGSMPHRHNEARVTHRLLSQIFADAQRYAVHAPLPSSPPLFDEGAANHTRLVTRRGALHLFGYGRPRAAERPLPQVHPARQGEEASRAIARRHGLGDRALLWQQSPAGIDAGAFHTDVLAVGERDCLLLHERAFVEPQRLIDELRWRLGDELSVVFARDAELPVDAAVAAYPFNSQLVERVDGSLVLVAPREAEQCAPARAYLERALAEVPRLHGLEYVDVGASMGNGGGPACLRLRVPLSADQRAHLSGRVLVDTALLDELEAWVTRRYRDRLEPHDLADPQLYREVLEALDELTGLLALGSVYDFQADPARSG